MHNPITEWRHQRKARKAAEEAARREAQQRAWHQFWASMHTAAGGTPVPYDPAAYDTESETQA